MKRQIITLWLVLSLALAGGVWAAPRGGTWSSDEGDFEAGIWQEIFYGGGEGKAGNIISAIGAQWSLSDATLESVEVLEPHHYRTVYTGGTLSLDSGGPWEREGDTLPYTASLGELVVYTTKTYDNGTLTELSWTMSASGSFDSCADRIIQISASYSGLPDPTEQDGYPGMTAPISSAELQITILATVDIDPDTLNLASGGNWITCYIQVPADYDVTDIEPASIALNGTVPASWSNIEDDGRTLMVKFSRSAVQEIVAPGYVQLLVTGRFDDGANFMGFDTIRVINRGRQSGKGPKSPPPGQAKKDGQGASQPPDNAGDNGDKTGPAGGENDSEENQGDRNHKSRGVRRVGRRR